MFYILDTLLKFNIAPENRPGPKRKGSSSNHHFFRDKLLVYRSLWILSSCHPSQTSLTPSISTHPSLTWKWTSGSILLHKSCASQGGGRFHWLQSWGYLGSQWSVHHGWFSCGWSTYPLRKEGSKNRPYQGKPMGFHRPFIMVGSG